MTAVRTATQRTYLLCAPVHFAVEYAINPYMEVGAPVDRDRALAQWAAIRDAYRRLGHVVHELEPVAGLPDMVFAANSGLVAGGRVLASRMAYAERRGEEEHYRRWFAAQGFEVVPAVAASEGEGDLLVAGDLLLAGHGFRTTPAAHVQARHLHGRRLLPLELGDPRFYHLDVAVGVVDSTTLAVVPDALTTEGLRMLREHFDLVEVDLAEGLALGANLVGDGRHVVLEAAAPRLADALADRGFDPVPVDTSELRRAGGSVKCCTLELHPAAVPAQRDAPLAQERLRAS